MDPFVALVTNILSLATVAGGIFALLLLVALVAVRVGMRHGTLDAFVQFAGRYALLFAFIVALVSVASSLFYSDYAGFPPCTLCWWQRIFLFPQLVILALALIKSDFGALRSAIALSVLGGSVSIYHSYLQFGGASLFSCSTTETGSAACSQRLFVEYGYVTIPTMALTGFALITLFSLAYFSSRVPDDTEHENE